MNFRRLLTSLDTVPALKQIAEHRDFWGLIKVRQQYEGSAHADTESIVLRGPSSAEDLWNNLESYDYPQLVQLPAVLDLLREVSSAIRAREIGRLMLVRLKADGWIRPHVDEGAYARYYARFHLVLESNSACVFTCGDESVHMAPGELWWFNHQLPHSVTNKGPARTHLIMDFTAPGFTGALSEVRL